MRDPANEVYKFAVGFFEHQIINLKKHSDLKDLSKHSKVIKNIILEMLNFGISEKTIQKHIIDNENLISDKKLKKSLTTYLKNSAKKDLKKYHDRYEKELLSFVKMVDKLPDFRIHNEFMALASKLKSIDKEEIIDIMKDMLLIK